MEDDDQYETVSRNYNYEYDDFIHDDDASTDVTMGVLKHDYSISVRATNESRSWVSTVSLNYSLPIMILVATVLFAVITATAIGNFLVGLALIRYHNLRTISNYLIGNLALSDFLLATTILPLSTANECLGHWVFGRAMCNIWLLTDVLYCTASLWNICVIALDRFTATLCPIWYREKRSTRQAALYGSLVWLMAGIITVPPLLGWNDLAQNYVYDNQTNVHHCVLFQTPSYVLYSASGSFFAPFFLTVCLYVQIFVVLRQRMRKMRNNTTYQQCRSLIKNESSNSRDVDTTQDKCKASERVSIRHLLSQKNECEMEMTTLMDHPDIETLPPSVRKEDVTTDCDSVNSFVSSSAGDSGDETLEQLTGLCRNKKSSNKTKFNRNTSVSYRFKRGHSCGPSSVAKAIGHTTRCSMKLLNGLRLARHLTIGEKSSAGEFEGTDRHSSSDEIKSYESSQRAIISKPEQDKIGHRTVDGCSDTDVTSSVILTKDRVTDIAVTDVASNVDVMPFVCYDTCSVQLQSVHNVVRPARCKKQWQYCIRLCQKKKEKKKGDDQQRLNEELRRNSKTRTNEIKYEGSRAATSKQRAQLQHRRFEQREIQATIRMAIIIAFFCGMWLGFFTVYVLRGWCPDSCPVPRELDAFLFWLGYSNSSINPILYTIFNADFRKAFQKILGCYDAKTGKKLNEKRTTRPSNNTCILTQH